MLLAFCSAILLGLVAARSYIDVQGWVVCLLGLGAALLLRRRTQLSVLMLMLFGVSLGIFRGAEYMQKLQPYALYSGQKVTITATVSQDSVYGDKGQLSFGVKDISIIADQRTKVPGTMKIKGFGELAIYRGDVIEATGKLYKTRGGSQASMSYAKITRVGSTTNFADTVRRSFSAGMQTALPEPLASFGLGLLVGQRNTLSADYSQALLMVGLTHIVAVSGYNLTILLEATKRILGGRSKQLSVAVGVMLMLGFLLVTGASASIVRASVVSALSLAAWYYGRSVRALVLIVMAAAITAMASPMYLWSDIGWYLSFLAFFGILLVAPKVLQKMYKARQAPFYVQIAVESLAAQLMTLPLLLYIFGQVSVVSIVANVLVVSVIPLAMLASFIAGPGGILVPFLSGIFAYPARFILTYMLDTALLLSRIPNVHKTGMYVSVWDMSVLYGLIAAVTYGLHRKPRGWFAKLKSTTSTLRKTETGKK